MYTDISLPGLCIIYIAFPGLYMLMYLFSASLLLYGVFSYYTGYSPIIRGVILFRSLGEQKEKGSATQEKNLLQSSVQIENLNPVLSFVLIKGASLRYI